MGSGVTSPPHLVYVMLALYYIVLIFVFFGFDTHCIYLYFYLFSPLCTYLSTESNYWHIGVLSSFNFITMDNVIHEHQHSVLVVLTHQLGHMSQYQYCNYCVIYDIMDGSENISWMALRMYILVNLMLCLYIVLDFNKLPRNYIVIQMDVSSQCYGALYPHTCSLS